MPLDIEEKIKHTLMTELDIRPDIIAKADSTTPLLGRGIGLDSIETLTLVAGIEAEFDIQIDDRQLNVGLFKNLSTLAHFVQQKVMEQQPHAGDGQDQ